MDYAIKAVIIFGIAFFPYLGLYIAVPIGFMMNMGVISALFWSIFGYFAVVPFVDLLIEKLMKISRFRDMVEKSQRSKISQRFRRYADWTLAFWGPLIGIWAAPVIAKLAGIKKSKIYFLLLIGTVFFSFVTLGIMAAGVRIAIEIVPCWLLEILAEQGLL